MPEPKVGVSERAIDLKIRTLSRASQVQLFESDMEDGVYPQNVIQEKMLKQMLQGLEFQVKVRYCRLCIPEPEAKSLVAVIFHEATGQFPPVLQSGYFQNFQELLPGLNHSTGDQMMFSMAGSDGTAPPQEFINHLLAANSPLAGLLPFGHHQTTGYNPFQMRDASGHI